MLFVETCSFKGTAIANGEVARVFETCTPTLAAKTCLLTGVAAADGVAKFAGVSPAPTGVATADGVAKYAGVSSALVTTGVATADGVGTSAGVSWARS